MRGQTESGAWVDGIVFRDQPWVLWREGDRTAQCERCGERTEIVVASVYAQLSQRLWAFWQRHRMCGEKGRPVAVHPYIYGEVPNKIMFLEGNRTIYLLENLQEDGRMVVERKIGVPAGILFEVREADATGCRLYAPGFGLDPYGVGPLHLLWERDWEDVGPDDPSLEGEA